MADDKTFYDSDDIRVRGNIDLHPQFYWRCIYQKNKDNFKILPFMKINNTDSGRADWMEVAVTQNHKIRYKELWKEFLRTQPLNRTEYSREEMMRVQNFRDKIEYNQSIIRLDSDHPEYWALVSDFSIRLNAEDIMKLNAIDGIEPVVEEKKPETTNDKILSALNVIAGSLDKLSARVDALENK